jgi:hypothetical protein
MTRLLSELLGASEPVFQLSLRQLEQSTGRPNADIRLSTEVLHGMQAKLRELSLDPHDTEGPELYAHLGARLKDDEARFAAALQAGSPKSDDPIAHVARALEKAIKPKACFALKNTVARRLLKANLPKKTMKALGYRSADSMLKHESAACLYAAAILVENEQWLKRQVASYAKLKVTDFENRDVAIEHPTSKRWQALADTVVAVRKHNIVSSKELGAVVLLPLPEQRPELVTLTTAVLTLHAVNNIQAAGTFLKLHQVQTNFGALVKQVATGEPTLAATLLDQPVSWHMVQHYYARFSSAVAHDVFEPVLHAEDFTWHSIEAVLTRIEPGLHFWQGTSYLGLLHKAVPVSCNLTDLLLSHCNRLPFAARHSGYFRHALRTELSLRYLRPERLSETIGLQLQRQLATEPVAA